MTAFNERLSAKRNWFQANFYLPKQSLSNFPELKNFEQRLTFETNYFRNYSIETNRAVNDILSVFKDFSGSIGAKTVLDKLMPKSGLKQLRKIQSEYDLIVKALQQTNNPTKRQKLLDQYNLNRQTVKQFYESGAGEGIKILNEVLRGVDIETIPNLDVTQKAQLETIRKNYIAVRKEGSISLLRGLEQIRKMAKNKNVLWADKVVDKITGLIKQIEFQKNIDENGKSN